MKPNLDREYSGVAFDATGDSIITIESDGLVTIRAASTCRPLLYLKAEGGKYGNVRYVPETGELVAYSWEGVSKWDASMTLPRHALTARQMPAGGLSGRFTLDFSQSSDRMVLLHERHLQFWDLAEDRIISVIELPAVPLEMAGPSRPILAVSPDEERVALFRWWQDRAVVVNIGEGRIETILDGSQNPILGGDFVDGGNALLCLTATGVAVYDVESGALLRRADHDPRDQERWSLESHSTTRRGAYGRHGDQRRSALVRGRRRGMPSLRCRHSRAFPHQR